MTVQLDGPATAAVPAADATASEPPRRGRRGVSHRGHWSRWLTSPFAWGMALFNLLVLFWIVMNSLKDRRGVIYQPLELPKQLLFGNYVEAWEKGHFADAAAFSVTMVILSGVGTILLSAPAAYALARFDSPLAGSHTVLFAVGLAVPVQSIVIPLYVAFDKVNLLDTVWAMVLVHIGTGIPFAVFLLTAYFRSLPPELEEAAAIDGAGLGTTFWRIMFPLARSGLTTVFMLQAIGHWGDVFFPLILLREKSTVSLSVKHFSENIQYTGLEYNLLLAGIAIIIAPVLIAYLILGRRMIEGISAGYGK